MKIHGDSEGWLHISWKYLNQGPWGSANECSGWSLHHQHSRAEHWLGPEALIQNKKYLDCRYWALVSFFIKNIFWIFVSFRNLVEGANHVPKYELFSQSAKYFLWDQNIGLRSKTLRIPLVQTFLALVLWWWVANNHKWFSRTPL